jgi:hypothetical protein
MSRKPEPKPCNKLCAKCLRHCKQPEEVLLVDCPRFLPFPFKVEKNRYEQIDLFGSEEITPRPTKDDDEES